MLHKSTSALVFHVSMRVDVIVYGLVCLRSTRDSLLIECRGHLLYACPSGALHQQARHVVLTEDVYVCMRVCVYE